MSKVLLFGDTHYGVRNDSPVFYPYQKKSNDYMFDVIREEKPDRIIHMGDLVDRRKYINFRTYNHLYRDLLCPLYDLNIPVNFILGNHDQFYRNTADINVFDVVSQDFPEFRFHTVSEMTNEGILLLPWICAENYDQSMEALNRESAIVCGHLEINGFEIHRGAVCDFGLDTKTFKKHKKVYSGHFHIRSMAGNIHYIGAAYSFTWGDYGTDRGFAIIDTDTGHTTYYNSPYSIFEVLEYTGKEKTDVDHSNLTGAYVRVRMNGKDDPYHFDQFIENLEKYDPVDISIFDTKELDTSEIDIDQVNSTDQIMTDYIESSSMDKPKKKKIKKMMTDLYNEAVSLRDIE